MKQEQNSYYGSGKYQPIDIIDYYHMDFNIANALKYVIRAGNKPGEPIMKDMDKAKDYLSNFERRLKINARIMYELRGYYSVARSYIEYIDFIKDLKESGLHDKALTFVESVLQFYMEMYYTVFPVKHEDQVEDFNKVYDMFVIYDWEGIKESFNKYYNYCKGISKVDDTSKSVELNFTTLHTSDNQTITIVNDVNNNDVDERYLTEYYNFVVYKDNGLPLVKQVLIPTSAFFEVTNNITDEVTELYKHTRITKDTYVELCIGLLMGEINYNYGKWFPNPSGKRNKDIISNIKREATLRFKSDYEDYFKADGFLKKLFK